MNQQDLKKVIHYDPETGFFTRLNKSLGRRAGSVGDQGYRRIRVLGERVKEHRLAWFYMTGQWPDVIDHKNRIRDDNRWENLRDASVYENHRNTGITDKNTSGVKGISWKPRDKAWEAGVRCGDQYLRRQFQVSTFGGIEQARLAAASWVVSTRDMAHGEYANHG